MKPGPSRQHFYHFDSPSLDPLFTIKVGQFSSIPWLRFTSIEHRVFRFKSADIPSVSWGKFSPEATGKLLVTFSVQADQGFVDAYHIYHLGEKLREEIERGSSLVNVNPRPRPLTSLASRARSER
jgi:chloramphenicol O-acetyltransferase